MGRITIHTQSSTLLCDNAAPRANALFAPLIAGLVQDEVEVAPAALGGALRAGRSIILLDQTTRFA